MEQADIERRRIERYRQTFSTEAGQDVLVDLERIFLYQNAASYVAADNALGLAYINGQKELILAVKKWLTMDLNAYLEGYKTYEVEMEEDPIGQSNSPRPDTQRLGMDFTNP
jgi:hypothetical protein